MTAAQLAQLIAEDGVQACAAELAVCPEEVILALWKDLRVTGTDVFLINQVRPLSPLEARHGFVHAQAHESPSETHWSVSLADRMDPTDPVRVQALQCAWGEDRTNSWEEAEFLRVLAATQVTDQSCPTWNSWIAAIIETMDVDGMDHLPWPDVWDKGAGAICDALRARSYTSMGVSLIHLVAIMDRRHPGVMDVVVQDMISGPITRDDHLSNQHILKHKMIPTLTLSRLAHETKFYDDRINDATRASLIAKLALAGSTQLPEHLALHRAKQELEAAVAQRASGPAPRM